MKTRQAIKLSILLYSAIFACIALVSYNTPNTGDDILWIENSYRPLNISEPAITQSSSKPKLTLTHLVERAADRAWQWYLHFDGRVVCNLTNGLAAPLPRWAWGMLNAALFGLLIFFVWQLSGIKINFLPWALMMGVFAMLNGQTIFWRCGSANYLWPATWTAGCAVLYTSSYFARRPQALTVIPLFFLGVISAGGHELLTIPCCTILCSSLIVQAIKRHNIIIDNRLIFAIGYGIGAIAMVLCPGNISRSNGCSLFIPSDILFFAAHKIRVCLRFLENCPILVIPILYYLHFVYIRISKAHICGILPTARELYAVIGLISSSIITIVLCDGSGRTSWFISLFTFLSTIILLPKILNLPLKFATAIAFFIVLLSTTFSGIVNNNLFLSAINRAKSNKFGLYILTEDLTKSSNPFNRAMPIEGLLAPGRNSLVGRYYEAGEFIGVPLSVYKITSTNQDLHLDRLAIPGEWYTLTEDEAIITPVNPSFPKKFVGVPTYANQSNVPIFQRILRRALAADYDPIMRTYAHESIVTHTPFSGFTFQSGSKRFACLLKSRLIPSSLITGIEIKPVRGCYAFECE